MFFSRAKGLVGLDLGSSAVKAVELKDLGKGRGFRLTGLGIEPLPPEAIVDGAIMDSGLVGDAIQRLFSTNKFKATDVALSLSGHSVIIKKISLPVMSPEELSESIQWVTSTSTTRSWAGPAAPARATWMSSWWR